MAYETDVLIIGAGPTGSTTALALANCGVRCHIVSRGNWMADSPRAHITNQRANEVFRDLGISEDVARYASPWELMGDTTFTTSLAGPELIRMRTWGTGDDRRGRLPSGKSVRHGGHHPAAARAHPVPEGGREGRDVRVQHRIRPS